MHAKGEKITKVQPKKAMPPENQIPVSENERFMEESDHLNLDSR